MTHNKNLEYWRERAKRFGETSIGYNCDKNLIYWDNVLRAKAISRLVKIEPGMKVLDAGAGAGYWAIKCAKAGAKVVGLDFNEDILRIARVKAREAGVDVTWIQGPLEKADLPAESFDVVLSITCLQHLTERSRQEEAIRRILRSLRSEGVFVLLEDTIVGEQEAGEYILTYSQRNWIDLVQAQGARLRDSVGVSFLRFKYKWAPALCCACIDCALSHLNYLKPLARVTAFAFVLT